MFCVWWSGLFRCQYHHICIVPRILLCTGPVSQAWWDVFLPALSCPYWKASCSPCVFIAQSRKQIGRKTGRRGWEVTETEAREPGEACNRRQEQAQEDRDVPAILVQCPYKCSLLKPSCREHFGSLDHIFQNFPPIFMAFESDINGLLSVFEQKCVLKNFF